jgi:hypothetical protein
MWGPPTHPSPSKFWQTLLRSFPDPLKRINKPRGDQPAGQANERTKQREPKR